MWCTEKDTMSVLFSPEIYELKSTYEKISEKPKVRARLQLSMTLHYYELLEEK